VEGLKEKRGQLTGGNYCSIPGDQPQVGYGSSVPGAREDRTQGRWPGVQSRSIDVTKAGYAASGDVARTQVGHDSSVLGRNKKTNNSGQEPRAVVERVCVAGADEDRPCNASCTDDPKTTEKLL
jgi:hypothetical protein